MGLYRSGKCRGTFELHELRRLHETYSYVVEACLAEAEQFGRVEVKLLDVHLAVAPRASRLKTNPEFEAPSGADDSMPGNQTYLRARVGLRGKPSRAAGVKIVGIWSP